MGTSSLDREKKGCQEGATDFRHVPPQRAGEGRALELPAHPSATAELLHSNRRTEKGTFRTFTPSPGAAGRDDQGWGDRVCQQCSRKSLQGTLGWAGNAAGSGCHEGQPSPGGQHSVLVGLSWCHGCWVAMILSSWSSKGCGRSPAGVGSCSGFLHGKTWLSLGTVLPPGAQKHLWDLCVWNQG